MTTPLYAIAEQYRAEVEALRNLDLPDEVLADTLESLDGELEAKAVSVAHVVRALEADIEACKHVEAAHELWRKSVENRANRLRQYLADCLTRAGKPKISGVGVNIAFRPSVAAVEDGTQQATPEDFLVYPDPRPDKTAIRDSLKAGMPVAGWKLEERNNLQIKP